eukprot:TRINITY_DN4996_c0_g1_i2.p3 TRINITY_DN4996_c0_g1~~TRINITY_DN4996_c0_g1_i2.p3  ORF type:complete len:139 (+),score=4.01 TRINITY_DN4996_c0_g1_i2:180-596(+)
MNELLFAQQYKPTSLAHVLAFIFFPTPFPTYTLPPTNIYSSLPTKKDFFRQTIQVFQNICYKIKFLRLKIEIKYTFNTTLRFKTLQKKKQNSLYGSKVAYVMQTKQSSPYPSKIDQIRYTAFLVVEVQNSYKTVYFKI